MSMKGVASQGDAFLSWRASIQMSCRVGLPAPADSKHKYLPSRDQSVGVFPESDCSRR